MFTHESTGMNGQVAKSRKVSIVSGINPRAHVNVHCAIVHASYKMIHTRQQEARFNNPERTCTY